MKKSKWQLAYEAEAKLHKITKEELTDRSGAASTLQRMRDLAAVEAARYRDLADTRGQVIEAITASRDDLARQLELIEMLIRKILS
jgi:hypothetical protein